MIEHLLSIADTIDLSGEMKNAPNLNEELVIEKIMAYKNLPKPILFYKVSDLPLTVEKTEKFDSHWYEAEASKPGNFRAKFC